MAGAIGGIFSAAGSIAAAAISAAAVQKATETQIKALEKQRKFVYDELNPEKVNVAALGADVAQAKNQLALQAVTDPELLRQRYASQAAISKQLQDITSGESASDTVAAQATEEALAGSGLQDAKKQLIDAALRELELGATLPPDLQAELVQTGLQRSGKATGGAGGEGFGGQVLTTQLGAAGIALQKQRQDQAIGLLGQAQNLETSRANILGSLFPNLAAKEGAKLAAGQAVLQQSNALIPEAGLGGKDVANIWLARVGATNQLAMDAANAAGRGGMATAQIINTGIGNATSAIAPLVQSWANNVTSSPSGGGGGSEAIAAYGGGSSYG